MGHDFAYFIGHEKKVVDDIEVEVEELQELSSEKLMVVDDTNELLEASVENLDVFLAERNTLENQIKNDQAFIDREVLELDEYLRKENFVAEFSEFTIEREEFDREAILNEPIVNEDIVPINLAKISVIDTKSSSEPVIDDSQDPSTLVVEKLDSAITEVENWKAAGNGRQLNTKTLLKYYDSQRTTSQSIESREDVLDSNKEDKDLDRLIEEQQQLEIVEDTLVQHNRAMQDLAVGFLRPLSVTPQSFNNSQGAPQSMVRNFATRAQVGGYGVASNFKGDAGSGFARFM